jgi:hypothetical protein
MKGDLQEARQFCGGESVVRERASFAAAKAWCGSAQDTWVTWNPQDGELLLILAGRP